MGQRLIKQRHQPSRRHVYILCTPNHTSAPILISLDLPFQLTLFLLELAFDHPPELLDQLLARGVYALPVLERGGVVDRLGREEVAQVLELGRGWLEVLEWFEPLVEEGESFLELAVLDVCRVRGGKVSGVDGRGMGKGCDGATRKLGGWDSRSRNSAEFNRAPFVNFLYARVIGGVTSRCDR